jgi:hypothetical protein
MVDKAFISHHSGFIMTFSNGYTISVSYSERSYSDQGETTAEVAVWHSKEDHWLAFEDGAWVIVPDGHSEVLGHQTPDQIAELISALQKFS